MVLERFKDAVSDVAETLRRAFREPACRAASTRLPCPITSASGPPEATCRAPLWEFAAGIGVPDLGFPASLLEASVRLTATLRQEAAWQAWSTGVGVCRMPVFRVEGCGRMSIPPLPRSPKVRKPELPVLRGQARAAGEPFRRPGVLGGAPRLGVPGVRRDLGTMLALPLAIPGEDFQRLSRAQNMRYTVQLVKATGENIRNLDVLGVYPVPVRGVQALRHDPRTGRILVTLGQEATGAQRGRLVLARKKDDRSFVSCFVED